MYASQVYVLYTLNLKYCVFYLHIGLSWRCAHSPLFLISTNAKIYTVKIKRGQWYRIEGICECFGHHCYILNQKHININKCAQPDFVFKSCNWTTAGLTDLTNLCEKNMVSRFLSFTSFSLCVFFCVTTNKHNKFISIEIKCV
jgi:hypothetical protein